MEKTPRVVLSVIPYTGFDRGLLDGIARYAQLHGPWFFYFSGDYPDVPTPTHDSLSGAFEGPEYLAASARAPFPDLRRWNATGIIARIQSKKIAQKILASQLPVVAIDLSEEQLADDNPLSQISEIRADSRRAGHLGAEHFLDRGFFNFAFCGYEGRIWSQHRQEGFCERLRKAGYFCDIYEPGSGTRRLSWKDELPKVAAWLKSLPKPTAIMTCSDIRGRQVLEAAIAQGINVPDDVAVLGVDDDHLICNLANPPLSSVSLGLEQAGYQAAELLHGLMSGKTRQPQRIMVESLWVVQRHSTDVVATDDRHLSAALRFIRDNARQPIGVLDVVRSAGPSRRGLEIRFQQILGHSIRSEIQRVRLHWARQLLLETNLPIPRIGTLVGFGSSQYLGNVFRRETGTTMAQFRRRNRRP
jgi:LacI family transcriptional regulator